MGEGVRITGAGMTGFGRHMTRSLGELSIEAVDEAIEMAGVSVADIDLIVVANSMAGLLQGQESIRGQVMFADGRFANKTIINVENACASGATALKVASMALRCGDARKALVVGVEKLFHAEKDKTFAALASASDMATQGDGSSSIFMGFYAGRARDHMAAYGTTPEMMAAVAAKNRSHGALNPKAQFREAVSIETVLSAREIEAPLTLLMCSPISDGAAALVLECARDIPAHRPQIDLRGQVLISGSIAGPEYLTIRAAAQKLYEQTGVRPEDIDIAEVHDATVNAEIEATEALGLVPRGEGGAFALDGKSSLGGALPVNLSGGLISRGHPVAATGVAQICELTWQLLGQAGARQAEGARLAISESHGGLVGDDVAAASVTLLERLN